MAEPPTNSGEGTEYFHQTVEELTKVLHDMTHEHQDKLGTNHEVAQVFAGLMDVTRWLVGCYSWDSTQMHSFDKAGLRQELEDKVLWHL